MRSLVTIEENVGIKVGAAIGHFAEKAQFEDIDLDTKKANFDINVVKIIMTDKLEEILADFSSSDKLSTISLESLILDKSKSDKF